MYLIHIPTERLFYVANDQARLEEFATTDSGTYKRRPESSYLLIFSEPVCVFLRLAFLAESLATFMVKTCKLGT